MTRRRIAPLATAALMGLAGGASGQVTGSLDVGAGTVSPRPGDSGRDRIHRARRWSTERRRLRFGATGIYSDAPAGRWNFQGTGFAQVRSPRFGIFEAEASGQLDVTRHFRVEGSRAVTGDVRLYAYPFRGASVWVRKRPRVILDRPGPPTAAAPQPDRHVGAAGRSRVRTLGREHLVRSDGRTDRQSAAIRSASAVPRDADANRVELAGPADIAHRRGAVVELARRQLDLDLALGRRFSRNAPEITIWGVSAARSLTPQLALVAGAGRSGIRSRHLGARRQVLRPGPSSQAGSVRRRRSSIGCHHLPRTVRSASGRRCRPGGRS